MVCMEETGSIKTVTMARVRGNAKPGVEKNGVMEIAEGRTKKERKVDDLVRTSQRQFY